MRGTRAIHHNFFFFFCSELAPPGIGTRFFHPILLVVRRVLTVTISRAANPLGVVFLSVLLFQGAYLGFVQFQKSKQISWYPNLTRIGSWFFLLPQSLR